MTDHEFTDLRDLLECESARINSVDFIAEDPVQFPRLFDDKRDIEIMSLLASTIAWGNRKMICRNVGRLVSLMEHAPYAYLMDRGYEELDPEANIHRTFFNRNLQHYLSGLRLIYSTYGSLEDFAASTGVADDEYPAWRLAKGLNAKIAEANGVADSRCLPQNLDVSALKRLNMALRWLVRDDGIVDLGVWKVLTPAQLYIPYDVHVQNTSRAFGLVERKAVDKRAVAELTGNLRLFDASDPVKYDFALFGLGIESKNRS